MRKTNPEGVARRHTQTPDRSMRGGMTAARRIPMRSLRTNYDSTQGHVTGVPLCSFTLTRAIGFALTPKMRAKGRTSALEKKAHMKNALPINKTTQTLHNFPIRTQENILSNQTHTHACKDWVAPGANHANQRNRWRRQTNDNQRKATIGTSSKSYNDSRLSCGFAQHQRMTGRESRAAASATINMHKNQSGLVDKMLTFSKNKNAQIKNLRCSQRN